MLRKQNGVQISVRTVLVFLVVFLLFNLSVAQAADSYPTRPISVIIGFNPGGYEVPMRPFIDKFQEVLKQPVKYEFKPGAGGAIAAAFVANQKKPDGYTLIGLTPTQVLNPLTLENAGYTMEDFEPICRIAVQHSVIVAKSDSPWRTLQEFIEAAKKAPGKLTYTASSILGVQHLPVAMLEKQAGFKITYIPSGGAAQALTAILGGHVDSAGLLLPIVAPHLKSGALRALAQNSNESHPEYRNIPTLRALGYRVPIEGFSGLLAPKGISKEVLAKLREAADQTVKLHGKTIEQEMQKMNVQLGYVNGQDWGKMLRQNQDDCRELINDIKKNEKQK